MCDFFLGGGVLKGFTVDYGLLMEVYILRPVEVMQSPYQGSHKPDHDGASQNLSKHWSAQLRLNPKPKGLDPEP